MIRKSSLILLIAVALAVFGQAARDTNRVLKSGHTLDSTWANR